VRAIVAFVTGTDYDWYPHDYAAHVTPVLTLLPRVAYQGHDTAVGYIRVNQSMVEGEDRSFH
jgi:hypothetical protein